LWLRWTWRDLRGRWLLVTVIALVIALGTGMYAALLSTSAWRTRSNDASCALLHTHDLALLIAFNSTSIGVDERSREHATMIAFGRPLRTVLAMTTVEAAVIGVLGTLAGIVGGYALLSWLVGTTIPGVMPELGVTAALTGGSILTALLLGIGTVSIAPLFTLGRMRRMDIPSTLRLVE
jgi:putative ABC transport system permease protein